MLFGQPPFSVVFKELMLWIKRYVEEPHRTDEAYRPGKVLKILICTKCYRCLLTYLIVLIAHNGFGFDFLFLLAENMSPVSRCLQHR